MQNKKQIHEERIEAKDDKLRDANHSRTSTKTLNESTSGDGEDPDQVQLLTTFGTASAVNNDIPVVRPKWRYVHIMGSSVDIRGSGYVDLPPKRRRGFWAYSRCDFFSVGSVVWYSPGPTPRQDLEQLKPQEDGKPPNGKPWTTAYVLVTWRRDGQEETRWETRRSLKFIFGARAHDIIYQAAADAECRFEEAIRRSHQSAITGPWVHLF